MKFNLPELPYPENALEPEISQKTISFHYGKHLAAYLDNTNKQIGRASCRERVLRLQ